MTVQDFTGRTMKTISWINHVIPILSNNPYFARVKYPFRTHNHIYAKAPIIGVFFLLYALLMNEGYNFLFCKLILLSCCHVLYRELS